MDDFTPVSTSDGSGKSAAPREDDAEAARRLLAHPSETYVNARVRDELSILVDLGVKVEMDALCGDLPRVVDDYLPKKIFDSDLVKL